MKIVIRSLTFDKVKDKYDYLLKEIDNLPENEKEIILDFRFLRWAEPTAMIYFGYQFRKIIEGREGIVVSIIEGTGKNSGYYGWMGLFKYFVPHATEGQNTGHVKGNNTYIPITNINVKEEYGKSLLRGEYFERGDYIIGRASQLARIVTDHSELQEILKYIIREIIRNVPEHSSKDDLWICGQAWPSSSYSRAQIVIMDEGIGVHRSLTANLFHKRENETNLDSLRSAIRPGISKAFRRGSENSDTDRWSNSGFGLYVVSELCKKLKGRFLLISGDNYVYTSGDIEEIECGLNHLDGTLVAIELPRQHTDIDSTALLNSIIDAGEKIAAYDRVSISKASFPSRNINF